ncbi:Starch-binding associating with outer membrane [Draconibacterium orientale]|uniref:Carbohydrate-binding protein SusD n=1 Tax=Draconibacterium orientale TaxID=1168034 RepID=X5DCP7_9BACT|nr:RagB/SusD family nutrient uptake outer membrane protein [Draconibacterium orientale]AHW60613.1 carbohydrate-binding protein SusD [Draconibacterium orientale]SET05310.1 Starch-binding associating with outer membrane [Draconibacterium orientale]
MKRKYIANLVIASVFISLFMSSCLDDFLEKPAGGAVTVDTIFHTKNQAQYAVASMYQSGMQNLYVYNAGGLGHSNSCARPGIITDEVYLESNVTWIAQNVGVGAYYSGTMTSGNTPDIPGYGAHYRGIRRANLVLKNIDMVIDADQAWIDDVKGQALFIRALQHFELFRYYGGIPIVTDVLGEGELKLPRRSVKTVVSTIVKWCDEAAVLLPSSRSATEYGKVTKLAALALKARVLLYAASPMYNTPSGMTSEIIRFGDDRDSVLCYPDYDVNRWKLAADAAKAVIDNAGAAGVSIYNTSTPETTGDTYATIGDYESVWNVYANEEMILQCTEFNSNDWGNKIWALTNQSRSGCGAAGLGSWGPMNNVPVEFAMLYEKRDGSNWSVEPGDQGDDLAAFIEGLDLDPRFYQSIAYGGMQYNSSYGKLQFYKGADGFSDGKLGGNDQDPHGFAMEAYKFAPRIENAARQHFSWPVFRLAEFYLSYAEALNEFEGPTTKAYDALNVTRDRAGMPEKSNLSQEEFRAAVHNERTVELAFENHRYNDLLRWMQADEVINDRSFYGFKTVAKDAGDGTALHAWTVSVFSKRFFPDKYYYLPFSNAEVSKNYLGDREAWDGQNPGW